LCYLHRRRTVTAATGAYIQAPTARRCEDYQSRIRDDIVIVVKRRPCRFRASHTYEFVVTTVDDDGDDVNDNNNNNNKKNNSTMAHTRTRVQLLLSNLKIVNSHLFETNKKIILLYFNNKNQEHNVITAERACDQLAS